MKRLIAVLSGIGVLVAALIVAAVAVLKSMDFNQYRDVIAVQVKAATGRDLTITGKLELEISLVPAIAVENVAFANAPWGSRPAMATVRKFAAEMELLPLLTGDIRINRVVLDGLDLLLESDAQGRGNWELATTPSAEGGGPGRLPVVKKVHLNDVKVAYRDGRSGATETVSLDTLGMAAKNLESPMDVRLKGRHNTTPFEVSGQLGPVAVLINGGKPYPVRIAASAIGLTFDVKGAIAEPRLAKGMDLKVAVKSEDVAKTLTALKPFVPMLKDQNISPIGPLDAKARLTGSAVRLAVDDLMLSVGQAQQSLVNVQGRIVDLAKGKGIDVAFNVDAQNLQPLGGLFGVALPKVPPLRAAARFRDTPEGYGIEGLNAKVGASDLSGSIAIGLTSKPRPTVTAALTSNVINLKELLPPAPVAKPVSKPAASPGKRVFPDDPLSLEALKAVDGDLSATIGRFVLLNGVVLSNIETKANLRNGKLAVKPASLAVGGGRMEATASLDGAQPAAILALRIGGQGVDWGRLLNEMQITDVVQGSKADAKIDLRGQGRSVRQIMAGLNGEVQVVLGPGRVRNKALERLGADVMLQVVDALNPFAKSDEFSELKCGVARLVVKDGMANIVNGIALETGKVNVVGSGSVNLKTEVLDVAFKPEAREGLGISLGDTVAGLVRISGTLGEPQIVLDQSGAAKTALSAGAAIATGGLSLLAQSLYNRTTADDNPCQTALGRKAVGSAKPGTQKSAPSAEPSKKDDEGTIGGAVRGIGEGIGRGLKSLFGQ
jgi:hypothetical protein